MILKVDNINVFYGPAQVIKDLSIEIKEKEFVSVIGGNGAGKTTTLKTISGLLRAKSGNIYFDEKNITKFASNKIAALGLCQVPEGRLLFPDMSVGENLDMGAFLVKDKEKIKKKTEEMFELFPVLSERKHQMAGTLSGGEQQMLAIARALMSEPRMIMFDEPSLGLSPKMVQTIFNMILKINKELGTTVLLVEQNVRYSLEISDRAYVIENGEIVLYGPGKELLKNDHVRKAYLGL